MEIFAQNHGSQCYNFGMKQKGFSLIELLVVVAIIGILAAVGVVAYNGYTNAAKISATKANHKQVVNSVSALLLKCEQDGEIILNYWSPPSFSSKTVKCSAIHHQSLRDRFNGHFEAQKFWNPYYNKKNAVQNEGGCGVTDNLGCTELAAPNNSTFTVKSYYKDKENNIKTIGPDTIKY